MNNHNFITRPQPHPPTVLAAPQQALRCCLLSRESLAAMASPLPPPLEASKSSTPLPQDKITIKQLKSLLKKKGVPVTGRKADLIERLKTGYISNGPKPNKPWQHSTAKKDLKRALLDPKSPIHGMSMKQIQASDNRYKQYPNFPKYYNDLKGRVAFERERVRLDDMLVQMHLRDCPRPACDNRGYPHWNTHAAMKLLEVDVLNDLHKKMKPQEATPKDSKRIQRVPQRCFCQTGESRGGKAESSTILGRQTE